MIYDACALGEDTEDACLSKEYLWRIINSDARIHISIAINFFKFFII